MQESNLAKSSGQPNVEESAVGTLSSWRSIILGLFFGGAFLLLAFRETSYEDFVDILATANLQHILSGIGVYALYVVARALRWSLLLAARTTNRPFAVLLRAVTWGTAANSIIPHSGEILRIFATRKPLGVSATSILGTIAAERLYDFATVIMLTAITLFFFRESPTILQAALLAICAMGLVVLVALALIGFRVPLMTRFIGAVTRLLPGKFARAAQWQVNELGDGIRAAFSNEHLFWIGILSICQWLFVTGCIYLSIESFDLGLSPWLAFIVLPLTIAGLTLPTAPVYLGTIQVCFLAGLTPFGVSNEVAIAVSAAYIGIVTIPIIVVSLAWYSIYVITRQRFV